MKYAKILKTRKKEINLSNIGEYMYLEFITY